MRPLGSPSQSNSGQRVSQFGEPYYSNEDVAILHDIVVLAQELLPTLPERERLPTNALFNAYFDILQRVGVNADHDNRYARILFKIGGLRGQGSLYKKFEEVLSRMGIEIEFEVNEASDHSDNVEESEDGFDIEEAAEDAPRQEQPQNHGGRRRRNSESTIWDTAGESRIHTGQRRNSFSVISESQGGVIGQRRILEELQQIPFSTTQDTPPQRVQDDIDSADRVRPWLESKVDGRRRGRRRSVSTHASMRIRRRSASAADYQRPTPDQSLPASDGYIGASEITAVTSLVDDDDGKLPPGYASHQVNPSLLEIKAALLFRHHVSFAAKQKLLIWRSKASKMRQNHRKLSIIAVKRDRTILLKGALADWRQQLLLRRSIAETKQFFSHLEHRAVRARDLYLMNVAFTHWEACAKEQVQRTALARRHIVRTRIFHAWREVTAVSELKVRRQIIKKFYSIWRRELVAKTTVESTAVQVYEDDLVEKVLNIWIQKHLNVRAATIWAECLKRRTLFRWIVVSHNTWEAQRSAEHSRRNGLLRNAWRIWITQTKKHLQLNDEAETHFQSRTCRQCLKRWRGETRVIPAKKMVQLDVRSRLLQGSFEIWLRRARQVKLAAEVDRLKIIREAWINWLHKSRTIVTVARVDGRVISQSIYKWILAVRCTRVRREANTRSVVTTLSTWVALSAVYRDRRIEREQVAHTNAIQKSRSMIVGSWYSRTAQQQQLATTANDFHVSRLLRGITDQWAEQARRVKHLQNLSQDADFYLLTSKSLRKWKTSTESARREKRKAAYSQIRRIKKINQARGILRTWKRQACDQVDHQVEAQQFSNNKNILVGTHIFDRWRAKTEKIHELELAGQEVLLRKFLVLWKIRSRSLRELHVEATVTYEEQRQTHIVKKWSLQSLQRRAQLNYALDIREKNAKRTFRRMFNYWYQRAAERRPSEKAKVQDTASHYMKAQTWSDLEEEGGDDWVQGLDEAATFTPIPGYLSTPSRRTERVMATAARLSTTPRVPLSTPFERQLRAQYSGSLLPSLRQPPGRSTLGRSFADIPRKDTN